MIHPPVNPFQATRLLMASGQVLAFAGLLFTEIRNRGWTAEQVNADAPGRIAIEQIVVLSDMAHNLSTIGAQIALLAANDPACQIDILKHECARMVRVIRTKDHDRLFTSGLKWAQLTSPLQDIIALLSELEKSKS